MAVNLMSLVVLPRVDFSFLAEKTRGGTTIGAMAGFWSVVVALAAGGGDQNLTRKLIAPVNWLKWSCGASGTRWSKGGAALWTGGWYHTEDIVRHQRVTAKRPSRARDSDSTT
jgi:hypothetical protein